MFGSYYSYDFDDLPKVTYKCNKNTLGKCNHCGNCSRGSREWGTTKNTCKKRTKKRSR